MTHTIKYTHGFTDLNMIIMEKIASCDNMVLFIAVKQDIADYIETIHALVDLGSYTKNEAIDLCDQVEGAYAYQMRKFRQNYN